MTLEELLFGGIAGAIGGAIVGGIIQYYSSKNLAKFTTITETQFKLYAELWAALTDVKINGDALWIEVNEKTLIAFEKSLKKLSTEVERKRILLDSVDYKEIKAIIKNFENYKVGKHLLSELFEKTDLRFASMYESMLRANTNLRIKKKYESLLNKLLSKLRNKIGVK